MRRFLLFAVIGAACGGDSSTTDGGTDATTDSPAPDSPVTTPAGDSVLERNHHPTRDAQYTQPLFTAGALSTLKRDSSFDGTIAGHSYAQVLYVDNVALGKGTVNWVIAVTENNQVSALDATTGAVVWQKTIGPNAASTGAGCGNVQPIGITGTPVIDVTTRTMFLSAAIGTQANGSGTIKTHEIHALSIDDGSERPNFPVDAKTATYQNLTFNPPVENQRGALAFVNNTLYVPYGGHWGDCGSYHGWVLGIPYPAGGPIKAFATSVPSGTRAAGIWAPGGIASDGTNLFVATGNTFGSNSWVGQEAIIRLQPGPSYSNQTVDYFVPHDWLDMDNGDVDIGGSGPVLVKNLVASLGKNGMVYLLDSANLGGIGTTTQNDGAFNAPIASGEIINAAATVTTSAGNTWLIAHGYSGANGIGCKKGSGDIIAMKITTNPPGATVEWCASSQSPGSPMITTSSDSGADAIVWFAGNHLNGWDVETGTQVYTGSDSISNIQRFTTPIAARGHVYIAGDDKVYAFHL